MAFEIRELVIRAVVDSAAQVGTAPPTRPGGGGAPASADEKIVSECVEQVLDVLRQREER